MAEFAQGNQFSTPSGGGVGPFILARDKPKNASDSFLTTYDTINKWRAQKEQEKLQKAKYLDEKLADLDFKTDGVLPSSKVRDFLLDAKGRMENETTRYYMDGADPTDPNFREQYNVSNQMKKQYEVLVDGFKSANTMATALRTDFDANPDNYDADAVNNWFHDLYDADPLQIPDVLKKMPKPRQKTVAAIAGDMVKNKVGVKTTTVTDPKTGEIREETGYDNLDELITAQYTGDAGTRDAVNENLAKLQEQASAGDQVSKGILDAYNNNALATGRSPEQVAAIQMMKPFFPSASEHKGYTPQMKEYWGWKYSAGGEEQDAMVADINHWFQMMSEQAGYYDRETGEFHMDVPVGRKLGDFVHTVTEPDLLNPGNKMITKTETRPNVLLEGKIRINAQGEKEYMIKTTESDLNNERDEDKWIVTNDPYKILNMPAGSYGAKRGMYLELAEDFGKNMGVYDDLTWNKDGFKPELYPEMKQPLNKDYVETDYTRKKQEYPLLPSNMPIKKPTLMTLDQQRRYTKFKNENGREPNEAEREAIMTGKQVAKAANNRIHSKSKSGKKIYSDDGGKTWLYE